MAHKRQWRLGLLNKHLTLTLEALVNQHQEAFFDDFLLPKIGLIYIVRICVTFLPYHLPLPLYCI